MFGKIIELLSAKKEKSSVKDFYQSKYHSFINSEFWESLSSVLYFSISCALFVIPVMIFWEFLGKDGVPSFEQEFTEVTEITEANQDEYIEYFEENEKPVPSLKICYINEWRKDIYYIRDDEKIILLGRSFNWDFEYDLSGEDLSKKHFEFDRCQKLDL